MKILSFSVPRGVKWLVHVAHR